MLTPKQRADLRSRAQTLKPIVHIGKEGVTDDAIAALEQAFSTRDLLKVKVLETAPDETREMGEALAAGLERTEVVQVIGRTVVLYRPLPEKPAPVHQPAEPKPAKPSRKPGATTAKTGAPPERPAPRTVKPQAPTSKGGGRGRGTGRRG